MTEFRWTEINPEDERTWPPIDVQFITDELCFCTSYKGSDTGVPRLWCMNGGEDNNPPFRAWFPAPPKYFPK